MIIVVIDKVWHFALKSQVMQSSICLIEIDLCKVYDRNLSSAVALRQ